MFYTMQVEITRYRWRASNIPTPWTGVPQLIGVLGHG